MRTFIWAAWVYLCFCVAAMAALTLSFDSDGTVRIQVLGLPILAMLTHAIVTRPPWRLLRGTEGDGNG